MPNQVFNDMQEQYQQELIDYLKVNLFTAYDQLIEQDQLLDRLSIELMYWRKEASTSQKQLEHWQGKAYQLRGKVDRLESKLTTNRKTGHSQGCCCLGC